MEDIDWYYIYISPLPSEDNKKTKVEKVKQDIGMIFDINNIPSLMCWLHLWKQLFLHMFNRM